MSNVYLQDTTLSAIGDAIRAKGGASGLILPSDMPTAIQNISSGGANLETVYVEGDFETLINYYNGDLSKIVELLIIYFGSSSVLIYHYNKGINFIKENVGYRLAGGGGRYQDIDGVLILDQIRIAAASSSTLQNTKNYYHDSEEVLPSGVLGFCFPDNNAAKLVSGVSNGQTWTSASSFSAQIFLTQEV